MSSIIEGTEGGDYLYGDGEATVIRGLGGDDYIFSDANISETIDGGDGSDWYNSNGGALVVDLSTGSARDVAQDTTDTLVSIENVEGSWSDDLIRGDDGDNSLTGGDGNDTLEGGDGNDQLMGSYGYGGTPNEFGDDRLDGGAGDDTLYGGNGSDTLIGGAGDDDLDGGSFEPSRYVPDELITSEDPEWGRFGSHRTSAIKTVDYSADPGAVYVDLSSNYALDGHGGTDWLYNINAVVGSSYNDTIIGTSTPGRFELFKGGAGNDTIDGGAVSDAQGNHNRVSYANASGGIDVDLATGIVLDGDGGTDTLRNISQVNGSAHNDFIEGSASTWTEQFMGGAGSDTIDGRGGQDRLVYLNSQSGVVVDLNFNVVSEDGFGSSDYVYNIEHVTGSRFDDEIEGNDLANRLEGHDGDDLLMGGRGKDTLLGGLGSDTLAGGAGDDLIDGLGVPTPEWGGGEPIAYEPEVNYAAYFDATSAVQVNLATGKATGGGGNDTLRNIQGVIGSIFNDSLTGSNRADVIESFEGYYGNDTINGGAGIDIATYQSAESGVSVNLGSGTATDGLVGLNGRIGVDRLIGIEGVQGSDFDDMLIGSDGDNLFAGMGGNDTINGGNGRDIVDYSTSDLAVNVTLNGTAWDGLPDADDDQGQDTLISIEGVRGSAFDDTLTGSAASDEFFYGGLGDNTIDGGGGSDWVDYQSFIVPGSSLLGVDVNLQAGTAYGRDAWSFGDSGFFNDTLIRIENVRGSIHDDEISGDDADNVLEGLGGRDFIHAGAGNDTVSGGDGDDNLTGADGNDYLMGGAGSDHLAGDAGNDTIDGGALAMGDFNTVDYWDSVGGIVLNLQNYTAADGNGGTDTLFNINWVVGSQHADSITGSSFKRLEVFAAGRGNDTIDGGAISAGADNIVLFDDAEWPFEQGVVVDLESGTATHASGEVDQLDNINWLTGTYHDDELRGSDATGWTEHFLVGYGDDTIDGRGGIDVLSFESPLPFGYNTGNVVVDLAAGTASHTGGSMSIAGIEHVVGSWSDDRITGDSQANLLRGMDGWDTLTGGAGNDTLDGGDSTWWDSDTADYSAAGNSTNVNLTTGKASDGDGGTDTLISIENVIGSQFNDILVGNTLANELEGGAGNDSLTGGGGDDTLYGGDGADTLSGGAGNDWLLGGIGRDRLDGGDGNDYMTADEDEDTLLGAGGHDTLFGGAGNDSLNGGAGNDYLVGGTGADTMLGGAGNDSYRVDHVNDRVVESTTLTGATDAGGFDYVFSTVSFTLGSFIEDLVLESGAGDIDGTGNAKANYIGGNEGDNVLDGKGGNDTLDGGSGSNTLLGGAGNDRLGGYFYLGKDTMLGGSGNDTYFVDSVDDSVQETTLPGGTVNAGGTDTVITNLSAYTLGDFVENLQFIGSAGNAIGTGNALANTIQGNSSANRLSGEAGNDKLHGGFGEDTLVGGAGNDALYGGGDDDLLDGGTGADTMLGGAGNDVYMVDSSSDTVQESTVAGGSVDAGGIDEVFSTVSFTLGKFLENLVLEGDGAIKGTGNTLDNVISGNAQANTLNGKGGNDTLTGGAGNDIFRFDTELNSSTNVDTITDFVSGSDKIQLKNTIFGKLTTTGGLKEANFLLVGSRAQDANDFIVYDSVTGQLFYDANGSAAGGAVLFAELAPATSLTHTDFLII
jgi:Ca2+-binding RTX toxin-like protein